MSSDIHQPPSRRSQASPPCAHAPSFISPSLIRKLSPPYRPPIFPLPLISPRTLSFLSSFFHPASYSSHLASSRLPLSFWTFSLGPSLNIPPPPPPPHTPPVMNESVCWLQFIFTEHGSAHCHSPLALHISIASLNRQRAQEASAG